MFDARVAGAYGTAKKDGRTHPLFVFGVDDLTNVRAYLAGMYVEIGLGRDDEGQLVYTLEVPDRGPGFWGIAIGDGDAGELEKLARDADCLTMIKGSGTDMIDLAPQVAGLRHDWSGRWSVAIRALNEGHADEARRILETLVRERPEWPQARHWLGRCFRHRMKLEAAGAHYRRAIAAAGVGTQKAFAPWSAGMLSDLGVAYKKTGDLNRAAVCLEWSLSLRPNHPEALATAITLLAGNEAIYMDGLTRILAIGTRDDVAEQLATIYAQAMGQDQMALLAAARERARSYDLERPLDLVDPPLTVDRFFAALG